MALIPPDWRKRQIGSKLNEQHSFNSLKMQSKHMIIKKTLCALALSLVCAQSQAALTGPDNYAECIFDSISPATGPQEILWISGECRRVFPQPSRRELFDPKSPRECYSKYQYQASSREAAKAIYTACKDYFFQPVVKKVRN